MYLRTCNTLNLLNKLPSYEIISEIQSIGSLKQADIDENITSNINSKYYASHEFLNLKNNKSFNIIHSNLNGLEHKFDDYSTLLMKPNLTLISFALVKPHKEKMKILKLMFP